MQDSPLASRAIRRQQWLQQVDDALRTYGTEAAASLALRALADGIEHPALLNLGAQARYAEGRIEEAVEMLKRARSLAPKDPHVLNTLGICLADLGRPDEALAAYAAAVRADPDMAAAHFNRGSLLEDLNDINGARRSYERAVALDPDYSDALAALAWLDAVAGDAQSAKARARSALARAPGDVLARMALASAALQEKDHAAAEALLSPLSSDSAVTPRNRSIVLGLIGDLLDAQGKSGDAFAAYQASNAALKALNMSRYEIPGEESALGQAERLIRFFESADAGPWQDAPPVRPRAADPRAHVFLVGFPRSGTTLLENVLATHPQVVSLEEKDCFAPESVAYMASASGLERLAKISSPDSAREREYYWANVRKNGVEPRGRIFIDKMPLSSLLLPVISKLFPNARILFARRDPRDVVLSCFRRRFGMNPAMYQLLTLDGAAGYYDAVMRLSEIYRQLFRLPRHVVRYESLVEDFEGTARAACDFLGIEWSQELTDFAARARSRGISTPSAAQVARGLNRDGQQVWRRYREQMAPVLPLLDRWVREFGYSSA
jgi:tetratricopeptide (TPR) repeat protein